MASITHLAACCRKTFSAEPQLEQFDKERSNGPREGEGVVRTGKYSLCFDQSYRKIDSVKQNQVYVIVLGMVATGDCCLTARGNEFTAHGHQEGADVFAPQ